MVETGERRKNMRISLKFFMHIIIHSSYRHDVDEEAHFK